MNSWSTELPRFCTRCGGYMVDKLRPRDYDAFTGTYANRREYEWRCQRIKWYKPIYFHDEFLIIEDPDKMIGDKPYRGILTITRLGF